MEQLCAGFARVNATPMMGIFMPGYFVDRKVDGVLDELEINALAVASGEKKALLIALDHEGIRQEVIADLKQSITEETGLPGDAIFIHAIHSHTAGALVKDSEDKTERLYYDMICAKMAFAAKLALEDLKPAKMGWGVTNVPGLAFIRRYRMKDGSVQTNPGVNNPNVVGPIGVVDDSLKVVRFDRENADTLIFTSFACHPDSIGGCKVSADWPGFLRRSVEKAIDNTKCIFFNGTEGDINHLNPFPKDGDFNDLTIGFDGCPRGYGHARFVGRALAGGVLRIYDKVKYEDSVSVRYLQRQIRVPSNMPKPEDMPEARRINDLHNAGRDAELPYKDMMLTTVVAEAGRMIRLEHGPEYFDMTMSGLALGNIVLIGLPGEPFNGVGIGLRETSDWDLVIPTCLTNGHQGYFPMKDAYEEGGYEARSSNFREGAAEMLIDFGRDLMAALR